MFSFSHKYPTLLTDLRIFFVDLPGAWDISRLSEQLYGKQREAILNSSVVIVRLPVDHALTAEEVMAMNWEPLRRRLPRQSIYALYSNNYRHLLSPNINTAATRNLDDIEETGFILSLRDAELRFFAQNSNAIIDAKGATVFRLPSLQFSTKFIRVGNIQTRKPAIDAVYFWMLPWLQDIGAIITETWTISSISLNASRLLARYSNSRPCRVDMVSQYHDGSLEATDQLEAAVERAFIEKKDVLFLLSACMSGRLEKKWRAGIEKYLGDAKMCRFLSLYKLSGDASTDSLCDLSDIDFKHSDKIATQFRGYSVIEIDRKNYFPSTQTDRVVRIKQIKSVWDYGRNALDSYKQLGFANCHRNSVDISGQRIRHHAIFLDIGAIVKTPRFSERLDNCLGVVASLPALIIVPPHPQGTLFAEVVNKKLLEKFGAKAPVLVTFDITEKESSNFLDNFKNSSEESEVLVIDDASISGERLTSYSRQLRDIEFKGRIHYLVGVARPEALEDWDDRVIQLSLRQNSPKNKFHTVNAVETVILPDWNEVNCPWCREEALLRRVSMSDYFDRVPDFVSQRLRVLQGRDSGVPLIHDVFVQQFGTAKMSLTMNSIFLGSGASQADVVAAVANKFAIMRLDPSPYGLKGSGYPDRAVINMNCYLGGWFTDSVIRAAIIRMVKRSELDYSDFDKEQLRMSKATKILIERNPLVSDLAFELALSSALGILPKLNISSLDDVAHSGIAEYINTLNQVMEES